MIRRRSSLICIFLVTVCECFTEDAAECFANEQTYKCHLSAMTPYRFIANEDDSEIKYSDCTASKIWMLIRHGTRYPGKKWIEAMKEELPRLQALIAKSQSAGGAGGGTLSKNKTDPIANWKFSFSTEDAKKLAPDGEQELIGLAERFQSRFPSLMPEKYSNATYKFKYTGTQRAEESAKHFALGLFGRKQSRDVWYPGPESKDPILRFYKRCKRWLEEIHRHPESYEEKDKFLQSPTVDKLVRDVSDRVGFKINYDEIHLIYTICAFETAWNKNGDLAWCNLLSLENFKVVEFARDLKYYWMDGYGFPLSYNQACVALKDMFDFFESEEETKTRAYFAHSGSLLKLLALVGIARDEFHLRHDSFSYDWNGAWRMSRIDAFASNIAFVRYDCGVNGRSIIAMHQERVIRLPGCPKEMPCPISTMKDKYPDTESECLFDEMCANAA